MTVRAVNQCDGSRANLTHTHTAKQIANTHIRAHACLLMRCLAISALKAL